MRNYSSHKGSIKTSRKTVEISRTRTSLGIKNLYETNLK